MKLKAIFPTSTTYSKARQTLSERSESKGFTIVELLVVIVVIGILAAITIVSYTGISNKATLASIQSDLDNASRQLRLFQVDNMAYPTTISTDCSASPTTTTAPTNLCIKVSPGNSFGSSYTANNTTSPQTYSLNLTNTNSTIGYLTNDSKPIIPTNSVAPLNPVADWLAIPTGDHYGNFYDSITKTYATVTRTTPKTIYDPNTQHIYDVPANKLGINPRSDGKNGSEAVIEEARTNYLTNSYGAANDGIKWTTGWSENNYTGATLNNSLVAGVYGNTAWRTTWTQASNNQYYENYGKSGASTFATGDNAVTGFWVKGSTTGGVLRLGLYARNVSDVTIGTIQFSTVTLTGSWQYVSVAYNNLPVGTDHCLTEMLLNGIPIGATVDLTRTAFQLEKGAFATSYIPTTTTAVTRNADVVTIPTTNWSSSAGTWIAVATDTLGTNLNPNLIGWGTGSGNQYNLFTHMSNGPYAQFVSGGVDASAVFSRLASYFTASVAWTAGSPLTLYCGGTSQNSSNNVSALTTPPVTTGIGRNPYSTGSGNYNGPIQRIVVYGSALSSSNISTATAAIQNGP